MPDSTTDAVRHGAPQALHNLLSSLPAGALPPFLRVLLATDGTVTKSLEAYFWEPIEVANSRQSVSELAADEPLLGKSQGDRVLRRQVQLLGQCSRTLYAGADSVIAIEDLPDSVRDGLETGRLGIGELLRDRGFETFRELIDFGGADSRCEADSIKVVWRRYLIRMHGKPLILIREEFPLAAYRQ